MLSVHTCCSERKAIITLKPHYVCVFRVNKKRENGLAARRRCVSCVGTCSTQEVQETDCAHLHLPPPTDSFVHLYTVSPPLPYVTCFISKSYCFFLSFARFRSRVLEFVNAYSVFTYLYMQSSSWI